MRTTLTIDPEIAERLREEATLGKRSFKEIVNDALRRGLGLEDERAAEPFVVTPFSSAFNPGVDPARLNQLVDELEAEEFIRRQSRQ